MQATSWEQDDGWRFGSCSQIDPEQSLQEFISFWLFVRKNSLTNPSGITVTTPEYISRIISVLQLIRMAWWQAGESD
jgi:hypothetical protein